MNKLAHFYKPNYCPDCRGEFIELYDIFNRPMNYATFYNIDNVDDIIDHKQVLKFKCTKCNKEYDIQWQDNFPYPLKHTKDINYFLNRFMKVGKR